MNNISIESFDNPEKMLPKKCEFGMLLRLLVPVINDDLERFHYPGEKAVFLRYEVNRLLCRIDNDTFLVHSNEVEPLKD
jgi:hypothetical protein